MLKNLPINIEKLLKGVKTSKTYQDTKSALDPPESFKYMEKLCGI